ncbi:MAG: hypothetical protein OEU26_18435, partial [Candidatus Tectomicrobia bacterium]|nr:hypothetical protein [Candidatus Tectomicrobia bacterium]
VVIGAGTFQTIVVRRDPELVAFTSPSNATGLLELEPEGEMLLPFEGTGVDTSWELQLPKAANPFDYSTLADVLITIEYTALNSFIYRQQVIQGLDRSVSAERPYNFRDQFVDRWYELHNPQQTATPMVVRFQTRPEDFPPNVEELRIQQVVLYFDRNDGATFEVPVHHLLFTEQESGETEGGPATTSDGVISTRRGNGQSWVEMLGMSPIGEWELSLVDDLPNGQTTAELFQNEAIENILFLITYSGRTPEWPA